MSKEKNELKIDFHVHTYHSIDSLSKPKDIIRICKKNGIVPAIADHNSTVVHAEFRSIDPHFNFIPAEEIGTDRGDLIGLFLNEPIKKKTPFLEAVDLIHGQGGLAYVPHMFDVSRHGIGNLSLAAKADIIEAFNGRCIYWNANHEAERFADEMKIAKGAGSDSHFTIELGKTCTQVQLAADELEPKPLLRALKSKSTKLHCHYSPIYLKGITYAVVAYKKLFRKI
jgi:predicted metal-dependent phosphoesterase TrpH